MSIHAKLIAGVLGTGVAIFLGSILLSFLVASSFNEAMVDRAYHVNAEFVSKQATQHLAAADFAPGAPERARAVFTEFLKQIDTREIARIKVWSTDGTVIYSDRAELVGRQFADSVNFRKAASGEITVVIKPKPSPENAAEFLLGQLMEVYVPIRLGTDRIVGVIEVYASLETVNAELAEINRAIVWFNLLALAMILIVGAGTYVFLRRTIIRPVRDLRAAAGQVAAGDFTVTAKADTGDEIGELGRAFNRMVQDLGEARRTLVNDRAYLDNILWSMTDALAVTTAEGTIDRTNRALDSLLGYAPGELVGRPIGTLFAGTAPVLGSDASGGPTESVELAYRRKDGTEIPVLFSAGRLDGLNVGEQGLVCVAQDITQRKAMEQALIRTNRQMQEDLRDAAEFQRAVLRREAKPAFAEIAVRYLPFGDVSGDFYDISLNREGDVCVFLGDATGHGVAAALMTMMVQIGIDSTNHSLPADEIMRHLNALMSSHDTGKFMTGIYLRVSADGRLRSSNAGHPPLIVLPGDGSRCRLLECGGLPLGVTTNGPLDYTEEERRLQPGDRVFAYTDGLTELSNEASEEYGLERLLRRLEEARHQNVDTLLEQLLEDLRAFSNDRKGNDDMTILGFEFR